MRVAARRVIIMVVVMIVVAILAIVTVVSGVFQGCSPVFLHRLVSADIGAQDVGQFRGCGFAFGLVCRMHHMLVQVIVHDLAG